MNRRIKTAIVLMMMLTVVCLNINSTRSAGGGLQVVPSSFVVSVPYDYDDSTTNKYQEKTISLQNTSSANIEITMVTVTCNTTKWDFIDSSLIANTLNAITPVTLLQGQPYTFSLHFKSPYTESGEGFYFGVEPVEFIATINWHYVGNLTPQQTNINITVEYKGKWNYLSPYSCSVGKEFNVNIAGNDYNVKVISANANSAKIEFDNRIYHTLYVQGQDWINDNREPDIAGGSKTLLKNELAVVLDTTAVENNNFKAYFYFLCDIPPSFSDVTPPPTTAPPTTNPPTTQPPSTPPSSTTPPPTSAPPTQIPPQDWNNLMVQIGNIQHRLKSIEENDVTKDYVKEEISHAVANIPLSKKADDAYTMSVQTSAEVKTIKTLMYVALIISIASMLFSVQLITRKQTVIEQTQEDKFLDERRTDIELRKQSREKGDRTDWDETEVMIDDQ